MVCIFFFFNVLQLILECKMLEGDAVDAYASPHTLSLGTPRDLESWLPQMLTSAPPPMTSVTVVLGHPPWLRPTACPRAVWTLMVPPAAPRQLLEVVVWPSHGALKFLLPRIKLSICLMRSS